MNNHGQYPQRIDFCWALLLIREWSVLRPKHVAELMENFIILANP
jgi:hypothetical protein